MDGIWALTNMACGALLIMTVAGFLVLVLVVAASLSASRPRQSERPHSSVEYILRLDAGAHQAMDEASEVYLKQLEELLGDHTRR